MSTENENETVVQKQKKFPVWIIAVAAVVVIAAVVIGIVVAGSGSSKKKSAQQLEMARKYVSDMNYDQAIIAYKALIDIDPKNTDAYIELAEVYIKAGQPDKADEILEIAKKKVDSTDIDRINTVIARIDKDNNNPGTTVSDLVSNNGNTGNNTDNNGNQTWNNTDTPGNNTDDRNNADNIGNNTFSEILPFYDENGNLVGETRYRNDGSYVVASFDNDGNIVSEVSFGTNSALETETVKNPDGSFDITQYDPSGALVSTTHINADEGINPFDDNYTASKAPTGTSGTTSGTGGSGSGGIGNYVEAYDESGNRVVLQRVGDGYTQHIYDSTGKLLEVNQLNSEFFVTQKERYEYDPSGNQLLYIHYQQENYNYDGNGNLISITTRTWTTDADGNSLGEPQVDELPVTGSAGNNGTSNDGYNGNTGYNDYDSNNGNGDYNGYSDNAGAYGGGTYTFEDGSGMYEYDQNGALKRATYYDENGVLNSVFEYDDQGTEKRGTFYKEDGSIEYYYILEPNADGEYEYRYYNPDGSPM